MKSKMKSKIMKSNKAFREFSWHIKETRLFIGNSCCRFRNFMTNTLNRSYFAFQEVLFNLTNVAKNLLSNKMRIKMNDLQKSERGDVPGWVLVVLMTTGLVTGIWTVAQPRLSSILKNSLDNMNSIR